MIAGAYCPLRWLLLLVLITGLQAVTADDVLAAANAAVSESERDEPGSPARAKAIAAAIEAAGTLPVTERLTLDCALAEAWLDGAKPATCAELAATVHAATGATPALRERAVIARAAAVRLMARNGDLTLAKTTLAAIATGPDAGARANAHVRIAESDIAMAVGPDRKPIDATRAIAALDEALELLKSSPPAERVPVYTLRLVAMERSGAKPADVLAWLQQHHDDPAVAEVEDSAVTSQDQLVGKAAPALTGNRVDPTGGKVDLASFRGKIVLIDFFATWCKPCEALAPTITAFALKHPTVQILSVSLDNAQSLPNLPGYLTKHAMTWPVLGEGLGWDGELDDIWHVDGIPCLFLVSADGRLATADLIGDTAEATTAKLEEALKKLTKVDDIP
ncbi:MAG: TlpA disulfide reductase family protein [Planctomycetota bacterium]|mgnify:CR=1 FL=1